jgi:hypothetical protein
MAETIHQVIPEMQPREATLTRLRGEAQTRLGGLTAAQLNWSPGRGLWSTAQILDHLNRVGYVNLPQVTEVIESLKRQGKIATGSAPFRYSFPERLFIRLLSPNPPFKSPVPPQFAPPVTFDAPGEEIQRFVGLQDSLRECLLQASGLDLKAVRLPSPVSRHLKFSLGAWLHALIAHEEYHWLQVEALLAHPQFPAPTG